MKLSSILTSGVVVLATSSLAMAAEEVGAIPTPKQGFWTGLTALIVFILVAAFLGVFVWPKIQKGLDDRANKIREEIASAEAARKQAKDALAMYEKSLAEARAEAAKLMEQARAEQAKHAQELRAQAEAELALMKDRARRDIDAAKRAAVAEMYSLAAGAATTIAARVLQREITPRDQQRLLDESMAELQNVNGSH